MTTQSNYINGMVKWFDSKKGYGFIHSHETNEEYFVHHARLNTDLDFSTLYDGEYVSFTVISENGKTMANDIKGVGRGPLLCETRKNKKDYRINHKKTYSDSPEEHTQEDHTQEDHTQES